MAEDASLTDFLSTEDGEETTDESGSDADAGSERDPDEDAPAGETSGDGATADEPGPADSDNEETGQVESGNDDTDSADATGGPAADVEPAEATYAWTGAGADCEDCGETVARRWRDEAGLVCAACKEW